MSVNILKEYLREKEGETTKTMNMQERKEYLTWRGYRQASIDRLKEWYVNVVKILQEKAGNCKDKLNTTKQEKRNITRGTNI